MAKRYGGDEHACEHYVSMEFNCANCDREAALEGLDRAGLIAKLKALGGDQERDHVEADAILLRLINDPEVTAAFHKLPRWYS